MNPISLGAALTALSVILGAFGTHGLKGKIGYDLLETYQTGTHYFMIHAIAILLYGLWHQMQTRQNPQIKIKPWPVQCFLAGMIIFTGSLFVITFAVIRKFGMITPIGGLLFIAGWIGFAIQASRKSS